MRFVGTAIFLVLAAVGTSARAQGLPSVETSTIDLGPYVQPGDAIRISGTALRRVGGFVVGVRSDTIMLGTARGAGEVGSRPVPLGAVDTLWTRGRWFWSTWAVGTSIGLAVGGTACIFSQADKCNAFPIATAVGIAGGALIGTVRKTWRKRYIRRDGGPVPTIGPFMER